MQYLIKPKDSPPFITKWFEYENNYAEGMHVYDLVNLQYTTNGKDWYPIEEDHL